MQTPLSEEDDDFMYSVENSNPGYLASTEQPKPPPRKEQKPVDMTANTGYDADNDPYTQMRNKRKISKIDLMEQELRQNTLKFEELSKAIEKTQVNQKAYIKKELQP